MTVRCLPYCDTRIICLFDKWWFVLGSLPHVLHIYTARTVIKHKIKSYSPPTNNTSWFPLTRHVFGRGISTTAAPLMIYFYVDYYCSTHDKPGQIFDPNHFVYLKELKETLNFHRPNSDDQSNISSLADLVSINADRNITDLDDNDKQNSTSELLT